MALAMRGNTHELAALPELQGQWRGMAGGGAGHWEVKKLKRLARLTTGMTPPTDDLENYTDDEKLQWVRPEDLNEAGAPTVATKFLSEKGWDQARQIKAGATLICCIGTIGKVGFTAESVSTNQQLTAAEFMHSTRYFFFAICAGRTPLEVASTGNVLRILNTERLGNIFFPCPPEDEATQIAAFLDRETAKIDELVAEQRRLMELLKEKRQAVISHAVTQGLNPDAPMKPSGIEWLGEVPAHWRVCSVRRVISAIEQGWSPECFSRPADGDEWGVLKAGCVNRGLYDPQENKALPAELLPVPEYEVRVGDVLMSRASGSPELVGSTALITSTREKLMLSDKIFRLRFESQIEPEFFVAALNSRPLRSQIEQALSGGNGLANNLPQSSLLSFFLCVPPVVEQKLICTFLTHKSVI